jgi:hypothetical protein
MKQKILISLLIILFILVIIVIGTKFFYTDTKNVKSTDFVINDLPSKIDYNDLIISDIDLSTDNARTTIKLKVKNVGETDSNIQFFDLILKDKNKIKLTTMIFNIGGTLKKGQEIESTIEIDIGYEEAYYLEISEHNNDNEKNISNKDK